MRRVVWSREAAANFERIVGYIEAFNPHAAERVGARLVSLASSLGELPERGRIVSPRIRELTVFSPYIIRYRVDPEQIVVLRVRHGARKPL